MNDILEYIVLGYSKLEILIYDFLIFVFEIVYQLSSAIQVLILPFGLMIFIGFFMFPPLLFLMFTPFGLTILFLVLLPILLSFLGRSGLNNLKRSKYASREYFQAYIYDIRNNTNTKKSRSYYKNQYDEELFREYERARQKQEEERRRRQQAENERWQRIFEEYFNQYGNSQGGYSQGSSDSRYSRSSYNPYSQFKSQYEQACRVLGVSTQADYNEIKRAYRRLAKKYHPDLSKEKNAEEMFKKVNNAFEFLSQENINRYKTMKN